MVTALQAEVDRLRSALREAEQVKLELDRRVYHLKTLYDVSSDIFGSVESTAILRNFLLMTMGNFGVVEGFVVLANVVSGEFEDFVSYGLKEREIRTIKDQSRQILADSSSVLRCECSIIEDDEREDTLLASVKCLIPFDAGLQYAGLMGMGAKLTEEPYNENDRELLVTLVNNLVISLKNAKSFEEISRLNQHLTDKNAELEETLSQLRAAMRKVEILESIKANLGKFVPHTVRSLIEESPDGAMPATREQDISVLFLDIQGYTGICERLNKRDLNEVIERHFSVFMDAIYAHDGDVNETAGDGLMVIFQNADRITNAFEAVRAAVTIREEAIRASYRCKVLYKPLLINMGINSGNALVGASKFSSITGSRWTYTARGSVTNVAARVGAQAKDGSILLTRTTADRVRDQFELASLGKISLKNVSVPVEVFKV